MGPKDYQDALDALNAPDAPPPVKAAAQRLVDRYSSAMAKDQVSNRTEASLEDQPLVGGPQGLDAMQAGGLQPAEDVAEREKQIQASEAQHPGIARALSLRDPTQGPSLVSPSQAETRPRVPDASLPNASKRPELAAPPEFHPPTPASPANPFDSVWGKLSAVKNAMPDWAGGGTEHYVEPSVEQFQQEMAPVLGPDMVRGANVNSEAFKAYADMKYMQAYQRAQAEGRGIVRDAFKPGGAGIGGAIDAIPGALTKAGKTLKSGVIGADEAITGGIAGTGAYLPHGKGNIFEQALSGNEGAPDGQSLEGLREAYKSARHEKDIDAAYSPIAKDAGFVMGALNPNSVGNIAGEAAGGLGARVAGKIGGGAAAGAVGAGAMALSHDAPDVALGDTTAREAIDNAAMAGFWGAPLGIIGGALGTAAENEGATLRRETPLGEAERGGARIRPIRGVDPGPTNRGLEARARAEGVGESYAPDVPGMLSHDLAEPFGKRAHARDAELLAEGGKLADFREKFAGDKVPLKNTIREILDAKKALVQSDGSVVDPARMKKLDDLLEKILETEPLARAPEYMLEPQKAQQLAQLENAVDIHGELGTPAMFKRDLDNMEVMSTPTRAITPQAGGGAAAERPPSATLPDVGPFSEDLPGAAKGLEVGMAGERIRSLNEARQSNPHAFDVPFRDAQARGVDVDVPRVVANPEDYFARMLPKAKNPEDLRQLVEHVRQKHESGSLTKEPFPHYDEIKRSLHQDRDAFTGETDAIKQSDTFKLENGETVRGYSAANAGLEKDISSFENLLNLLGYKGKPPNLGKSAESLPMENLARKVGQGGRPPEIDRAFRQMAAETGMEPTLENLQRYLSMKEIERVTKLREVFRFGGLPSVGSLSGEGARLRLDPVVQGSIPYLKNLGSLGAAPGEVDRNRELPGMADQATLDEIKRALQP